MRQDWILVNLDRREYIGYIGAPSELFEECNTPLTWALSVPLEKEKLDPEGCLTKFRRQAMDRQALGVLGKLPLEMLRAVFSNITDVVDTAALTFTNRSLVDLGLERVRDILYDQAQAQSWAGDRLVCIGDHLEYLPRQILTEAEFTEFSKSKRPLYYQVNASDCVSPDTKDSERYDAHLTSRFVRAHHECRIAFGWRDYRLWRKTTSWKATAEQSTISTAMESMKGWDLQKDVWAACNLDKKQYVHQDAVKAMNERKGGPFKPEPRGLGYCRLGFVVVVLVCWSQGKSDYIEQGLWAGDRVVIMAADKMRESEPGEWEDISEEATRLTFAAYYG